MALIARLAVTLAFAVAAAVTGWDANVVAALLSRSVAAATATGERSCRRATFTVAGARALAAAVYGATVIGIRAARVIDCANESGARFAARVVVRAEALSSAAAARAAALLDRRTGAAFAANEHRAIQPALAGRATEISACAAIADAVAAAGDVAAGFRGSDATIVPALEFGCGALGR